MNPLNRKAHAEVPAQIFREFLENLSKASIPGEVVERSQTTILEEKDLSETALRRAMFPLDTEDD